MQVTIQSTDRLDDVMKAVGAVYGVELQVASGSAPAVVTAATATRRRPGRPAGRKAAKTGGRRAAKKAAASNDTGAIRTWARSNGYNVSERGRISADVLAAYQAAN